MFKERDMGVKDGTLMITGFSLKCGISNDGRQDLRIEMFKLCAGPRYHNMRISNYNFDNIFESPKETIRKQEVMCDNCNKNYKICLSNDINFFTIYLKHHELLKIKSVNSKLK